MDNSAPAPSEAAPKVPSRDSKWAQIDKRSKKSGMRPMVYWPDGRKYHGEWKDNMRHGKGTMYFKNGDKYQGEWLEDYRHGRGMQWRITSGEYQLAYSGEWRRGRRHGRGIYYDEEGLQYSGQWADGKRQGRGRQQYADSSAYEGDFCQDQREGQGRELKSNGDLYIGSWKNDMKNGEGVVKFYRIMKKYKGVWVNNVPKCGEYKVLRERAPRGLPKGEIKSDDSDEEVPDIPELTLGDPAQVLQAARNNVWKGMLSEM